MKENVPVYGRSRDEWPAGRAGPRRKIPDPIPRSSPQLLDPLGRIAMLNFDFQLNFFMKRFFQLIFFMRR